MLNHACFRSRLKTLISVSIILSIFLITASITAFAETITYTYDNLNRLTKIEYGSSTTITYTYDDAGNRLTLNIVTAEATPTPTIEATPTPMYTPTIIPQSSPTPTAPPTAIGLVFFKAVANKDGSVTLIWETATEINNAGYNLYRSEEKSGTYTKINDTLIESQGNTFSGANYSYLDIPLKKGTYYYKLEDVDYEGKSTMHGPVTVRVSSVNE